MSALRLYYLTVYFGLGAIWPLLALAFEARGFKPSQYAWLMALVPLSRLVSPPLWGALADTRFGASKLLRINTCIAALAMLGLVFARASSATVAMFAVWAFFVSSLVPLVEAGTYQLLGLQSARFGYVRVFGSIGFAVSALGVGLLDLDSSLVVPFVLSACGYLAAALSAQRLGEFAGVARVSVRGAFEGLMRRKEVVLLWSASLLYYAAHAVFDMYFGPFARALPGVRPSLVSTAWAIGVAAEIAALFLVPRLLTGRATRLLLPGCALLAGVRWWLTAQVVSAAQVLALQPLHAVTFGIWYLAFVHENQGAAPKELRATVQGIGAACLGFGTLTATVLGGYGLERFGGRAMFKLASAAALGAFVLYVFRLVHRPDEAAQSVGS